MIPELSTGLGLPTTNAGMGASWSRLVSTLPLSTLPAGYKASSVGTSYFQPVRGLGVGAAQAEIWW